MKRNFMLLMLISVFNLLKAQDGNSLLKPPFADNSILAEGEIYKLEITQSGIYKINYEYLTSIGINPESVSVEKIQLYNNGEGRLKQKIENSYLDDLIEIPYITNGLDDNKFDKGDYILFYACGPDKWTKTQNNLWQYDKNIYSKTNYVFLRLGIQSHKPMPQLNVTSNPQYLSKSIDAYGVFEEEISNLLAKYPKTSGSGQDWYGESVNNNSERDFSDKFSSLNLMVNDSTNLRVVFAGRDDNNTVLTLKCDNTTKTYSIDNVNTSDPENVYADKTDSNMSFITANIKPKISIKYSGVEGWLDKIEIVGSSESKYQGTPMYVSDRKAPLNNVTQFSVSDADQNLLVLQIDDISNYRMVNTNLNGSLMSFKGDNGRNGRFIVFSKTGNFQTPGKSLKIANQNLHSINDAEMLIVYHADMKEQAEKFASYRSSHSNIKVYAIDQELIYNEFSCGKKDPTAIRDFARMLKLNNSGFSFLLLFGDGSYDARGIETTKDNFIPVYETISSLDPINSFPSDDYFGLLSIGEGSDLSGSLDIAVGRFPIRSAEQAENAIQKVIDYETNPEYFGEWVNNVALAADDEDVSPDSAHFYGAEKVSKQLSNYDGNLNIDKIYLDFYTQEQNSGGQRYPDVNKAINDDFYKGLFMFIYFGHGGPKGLAQERILQVEDINSWSNKFKLPLLITATCSFTGFDDPSINTAGEETFLKTKGGVIALITTVRAVYASSNDALIKAIIDAIFKDDQFRFKPIGEIMRVGKNQTGSEYTNMRKFLLFGDPSMKLKFPKYKIKTEILNTINVSDTISVIDTLKAMKPVFLKGSVVSENNTLLSDFNGIITVTLYDKEQTLRTKANDNEGDPSKQREFKLQKNILFKGTAKVINGEWELSFIVPKDINYNYGSGKISYYAVNDKLDAASGRFSNFIIGGTYDKIVSDNKGPDIDLYMNDINFANGGITNPNPILLGRLGDESGINITGLSIGHDLSIEKNHNGDKIIINDFYKSEPNNFKKGSFEYPFVSLDPGKYTLNIVAYDIYNNRSEKSLDFVVVDDNQHNIQHLLNYPNPFSNSTEFRFEHDMPDSDLEISVNVFTLSGKLVKTLHESIHSTGFAISGIHWDGKDDFGINLANGVYVYNVKVFAPEYNITRESKFEKLVIIR